MTVFHSLLESKESTSLGFSKLIFVVQISTVFGSIAVPCLVLGLVFTGGLFAMLLVIGCLVLISIMFIGNLILSVGDEVLRRRRHKSNGVFVFPTLLNLTYIWLFMLILFVSWIDGVFIFLLAPLLWPVALISAFRRWSVGRREKFGSVP